MAIAKNVVAAAVMGVAKNRKMVLSYAEVERASEVLKKRAKADWGSVEWDAAITSLIESWKTDPMAKETAQKALAANEVCPICQKACEPITLMRGRKAFYCRAHNVATPAIVNS